MEQLTKSCRYCGRDFEWRKKWEKNWTEVQFCSSKCKKQNMNFANSLEDKVLSLLETRGTTKTICPSEILESADKKNKIMMERVRCAARRLVHKGQIHITQKGKVVDPSSFKGPIRLKLR